MTDDVAASDSDAPRVRNVDVTVAVTTYYRPEDVDRLLDALSGQTRPPTEVVLAGADDAETDAVVEAHEERYEDSPTDLRYFRYSPDLSMQEARNRLVDAASGDAVAFLDDDAVPVPEWYETVTRTYETDGDVVAVGGPALKTDRDLDPVDEPITDDEPLNALTEYGEVTDASGRWVPPTPRDVPVCRGANMSFLRPMLEDIGGFDPGYGGPGIFEEWDVMARLHSRGESIRYHPDAVVYHVESPEGGSRATAHDGRPGTYWYARNSVRFRKKNAADRYRRSLLRLLFRHGGQVPSVWRRLLALPLDSSQRHWLMGYLHGVVYEDPPADGDSLSAGRQS